MRVLIDSATRVQPAPSTVGVQLEFFRDVEFAIARSQNYLLGIQKPEGYWVGELFVDSTLGQGTTFHIFLPRHIPGAAELGSGLTVGAGAPLMPDPAR